MAAGMVVGLVLVFQHDHAEVSVSPRRAALSFLRATPRQGANGTPETAMRVIDNSRGVMYIYTMDRTQIYLSEAEARALDREAARTGRSRSQLIREAVDQVYLGESGGEALAVLDSTAGAWKGRREAGARYVGRLRRARLARTRR